MGVIGGRLLGPTRLNVMGVWCRAVVLVLLFCWLHRFASAYDELVASFYGDSYIEIPVQDSRPETDIRISFKTTKKDGLLLLAVGTFDYCLVALQSGMIIVRLDLGSGDAVLSSPLGLTFHDFLWHSVHVKHQQGNVSLVIDGQHLSSSLTPGSFFELNIDKNLYAGGIPDSLHLVSVKNIPAFRGCFQGVMFNTISVLGAARDESNLSYANAVTWDCSSEFSASSDQTINFLDDLSYIVFPMYDIPNDIGLNFDLRTKSPNALLVFSSGSHLDSDFFAIEIVRSKLKLSFNQGTNIVVVQSERKVNNGNWLKVGLTSDGKSITLALNGSVINRKEGKTMQLTSHLYVGGVGNNSRAIAMHKELESLRNLRMQGNSLIGCIRNFTINNIAYGFREALVTKKLAPGCSFNQTCMHSPCQPGKKCHEENNAAFFHCVCQGDHCTAYATDEKDSYAGLVRVQDLVVTEGTRVALSTENLAVMEEYKDVGIKDSEVLFQVVNPPKYGEIFVNGDGKGSSRVEFTVSDLLHKRVTYIHDDSEVSEDSIGLQLEFLSTTSEMPEKFKNKYGITLMIKVVPNNDRPELILPANNSLAIVSGVPVKISTKILNVLDLDDLPSSLEYTILSSGLGFFELVSASGARAKVMRFLHSDVLEGKVRYSHKGATQQEVKLRVSDGKYESEIKSLKIVLVPLELMLTANTGLLIRHGSTELITRFNLSVTTNAIHQEVEVRYNITNFPLEGEIQRLQNSDNQWVTASAFSQRHIDRNRMRYIHRSESQSLHDYFRFQVSALHMEMLELEFRIHVTETKVELLHCTGLHLRGEREDIITSDALKAESTVPYHKPSDIIYNIIATPTKGYMFRLERQSHGRTQRSRLSFGANFSQEEINEGKIGYKFQKALYNAMTDDFEFILLIPGAQSGVTLFALSYEPVENAIRFINNGLTDVLEGERKMISSEDLFTEKPDVRNFRYTVTDGPHHGFLQLVDAARNSVLQNNITTFSNDDIKERRVYYKHDDSETEEDIFSFTSTPIIDQPKDAISEITELSGTFEVKIMLRNDNAPKREVEKVFKIVANRGRIITPNDIWYTDPDVNFPSHQIAYEWYSISNGQIVHAKNRSVPVYRFLQKDIAEGLLYFKHHGPHYSRSVVLVTDGHHFSTGFLEVEASEPFVRVANISEVIVEKGQSVDLLTKYFNIETNLDASDQNVWFVIVEPPLHGVVKRNKKARHRFNMNDLKSELVVYEHDGGSSRHDNFKFLVKIENFQSQGTVQILITSDAFNQHSPKVVNNKVAIVEELDILTLTSDLLNVTHPAGSTACIKFSISNPPKHGRLFLAGKRETTEAQMFMQQDIDAGLVTYRHLDKGQLSDVFQFDVLCGSSVLTGLEFVLDVIPSIIPLEVLNLTVEEGEDVYISEDILQIGSKFYRNQPVEFLVVVEPRRGKILNLNLPGVRASQFSMENVKEQKVIYSHDDSESISDEFKLVANLRNKKSDFKTVHVTVIPKNDEPPVVFVNKKMEIWTGAVTPITRDHLYAEDNDTEAHEIVYLIGRTTNGGVSLIDSERETSMKNFTQMDINNNLVIFTLQGDVEKGSFEFAVTDGITVTESMTFHIESKSLLLFTEISLPFEVFPGLVQPITSSHLKATTNDSNHSHPIVYTVHTKPSHGRLITDTVNGLEEVTSFFQDDLNSKLISYEHTAAMKNWSEMDSFTYEVRTAYAPVLTSRVFEINISYSNINEYNKEQLVTLSGTVVDEGGVVVISESELDVSKLKFKLLNSGLGDVEINFIIQEVPQHGNLQIRGENATVDMQFTQNDIKLGHVSYSHDHSESLWDAFSFAIELETRLRTNVDTRDHHHQPHPSNTFTIMIRPKNDQPFVVRTHSPSIKLIQGFSKNITRLALLVEDLDTPPDGIKYEIVIPPSNGVVVNINQPNQSALTFTQKDIDENRIIFLHDGSADSSAFYFRVSDGGHEPLYKVFNICVIPLSMELIGPSVIELRQGQISSTLSSRNLNLETNGRKDRVMYNIIRGPYHGRIYLQDAISERFSQADVEEGKVTYIQTDINHYNDSVEFTLSDTHNILRNRRLDMVVRPNLKKSRQPFRAVAGDMAIITVEALDASDLARDSGSDPVYYVTLAPRQGELNKTKPGFVRLSQRDTGRKKSKSKETKTKSADASLSYMKNAIFVFTHDDIVNRRISYHPVLSKGMDAIVRDSFSFFLTANNVQAVPATLDIEVRQKQPISSDNEGLGEERDLAFDDSTTPASSRKREDSHLMNGISSHDHLKIVFLVCGIILIILIALIAFKCYKRQKKKRRQLAAVKEDSKSPLADPSSPHSLNSDGSILDPGLENRVQSLNSVQNAGAFLPVINVTPDTPTQGRHNISNKHLTEAVVELPSLNQQGLTSSAGTRTVPTIGVPLNKFEENGFNTVCQKSSPDGICGKKEHAAFDWENVDPELLEHCRKTTPVLHKNQYWV